MNFSVNASRAALQRSHGIARAFHDRIQAPDVGDGSGRVAI
jgi:hypothetical protein